MTYNQTWAGFTDFWAGDFGVRETAPDSLKKKIVLQILYRN